MFLINLTKQTLEFRAHNDVLFLKPGVNFISNNKFNAGELKNHFGNAVTFVTEQDVKDTKGDENAPAPVAPEEAQPEEVIVENPVTETEEVEDADIPKEVVIEEAPKAKATKTTKQTKKTSKK